MFKNSQQCRAKSQSKKRWSRVSRSPPVQSTQPGPESMCQCLHNIKSRVFNCYNDQRRSWELLP
jgi:hypothetical protein